MSADITPVRNLSILPEGALYKAHTDINTGAGTSDITLGSIDVASIGFLNGSYQQFDYNSSFPWGLEMGGDSNYAGTHSMLNIVLRQGDP
jgi:hypothetical protein